MSRMYSHKRRKVTGFVEEVAQHRWWGRLVIDDVEYTAEFDVGLWPADKRHLLQAGVCFTFPGRRDGLRLYVIDGPPVARSRLRRARIEGRRLARELGFSA